MTNPLTLSEFLLTRVAEDETAAQRAGSFTPWNETFQNDNYGRLTVQPTRVLAECEAKRRIVELHKTIKAAYPKTTIETDPCCEVCTAWGEYPSDDFPCETVRLLALPYADHEDFRPEWAI